MSPSESVQHREIKKLFGKKLKEWTGATLQEFPSSGHKLDVFAVTPTGISIYAEIICKLTKQFLQRYEYDSNIQCKCQDGYCKS